MVFKRLLKTGQITIPKMMERELNLKEGYSLYIYINKDSIIIAKNHSNKTLNQCIYRSGKVSIPAELRRLVGISYETPLEMALADDENMIIIKTGKNRILLDKKEA